MNFSIDREKRVRCPAAGRLSAAVAGDVIDVFELAVHIRCEPSAVHT